MVTVTFDALKFAKTIATTKIITKKLFKSIGTKNVH